MAQRLDGMTREQLLQRLADEAKKADGFLFVGLTRGTATQDWAILCGTLTVGEALVALDYAGQSMTESVASELVEMLAAQQGPVGHG